MVEFETVRSDEVEFGDGEFIEVAVKRAVSGEGEDQFISLTRGYVNEEGDKRYKSNFSIPRQDDVVTFLAEKLPDMLENE
ncbi:MAG: hypothetical protein SV186_02570 [Candidatus Nanohaloarchaea archaeon]|nr:hypothetical protein [Candidatus Nanohaloarchaea archaeon]